MEEQRVQLGCVNSKKGGWYRRRAQGCGIEQELVAWINSLRALNLRVTRSNFHSKAIEFAQAHGNEEFTANNGWVDNFLRRHSFSLRRRTTVGQRLPQDLITKVVGFIMMARRLYYPLSLIGNMDETPLWLDMPGETTITRTGQRSIPLNNTGHEKGRFTVIFAALADGRPFVVFKRGRPIAEMNTPGVVVALSHNG